MVRVPNFRESFYLRFVSSIAIDVVQAHCSASPHAVSAYWYFTVSDQNKQNASAFLSSVSARIYAQRNDLPQELRDSYERCGRGTMRPGIKSLMEILYAALLDFDDVYIIVDALDECPKSNESREHLLDVLADISSWNEDSSHLFFTSRKEVDIERALCPIIARALRGYMKSLQDQDVLQDTRTFVKKSLQGRAFPKWRVQFKDGVEEILCGRCQGSLLVC